MKLSNVLVIVLALVSLATAVVAQTNAVNNSTPCSLATLNGTYGVWEQGTILQQLPIPNFPPPPYPTVLAAIATYDGQGNESGTFKTSIGGAPLSGTFAGTYSVNPDCTYTEDFVPTPPGIAHLHASGIITGQGTFREIHYIYTDPDRVISGIAKKTPPGGCSLKTFKGKYVVFGQGTITTQPPLLIAHVGPFIADGRGHFSGSNYETTNGFAVLDTFSGSAEINPDCTWTAVITASNGLVTPEWGTFTGEGRSQEFHGIATNPGMVFIENGNKQ